MTTILGPRELNRALLARQLLLERVEMPVAPAVAHLVGLQAQAPMPPYLALWSRLGRFDPHELGRMLTERAVVRLTLMRATVHLVTPRDAAWLRPLVKVAIERNHNAAFGRRMAGAEPAAIVAAVRAALSDGPLTARQIASALVARGIGDDVEAIGNAVRAYVPLVQLPPRGVWGAGGQAKYATLENWTGLQLEAEPSVDELVLRYLRAFGPASVMDLQNWSGLTRLKPVFERLRDRLVVFADESGRELFDLPDAPRPGADAHAPVRLLGEYDNVLLGHADRSRIIPAGFPWQATLADGRHVNNLLIDGMLRATWWLGPDALAIRPFGAMTAAERDEVKAEALAALAFLGEPRVVRFEPPG